MSRIFSSLALLGFCLAAPGGLSANDAPVTVMNREVIEPFLEAHCVRCHGPEKQKGQVRFDDEAAWKVSTSDAAQRWQDVLDVLNGGDMPPEDEEQPSAEELAKLLDALTGNLIEARQRLTDQGGEIKMRRLNRREYANSIEALFGFKVSLDKLPEDGGEGSFDTVGAEQYFTSLDFERYLESGREIVKQGFKWAAVPRQPVTTQRREPEERVTQRMREKLADLDEKMRMKKEGKTWKEMGFKDEGEAQIIFSQFDRRAGHPRKYLQYPLVDSGIYLSEVNNETRRFGHNRGGDPRASFEYRFRGGVVGDPQEIRRYVRVSDSQNDIGTVRVLGTPEAPQVMKLRYRQPMEAGNVGLALQENRADIRVLEGYLKKIGAEEPWASIYVDWIEIEGPFYPEERAFFERILHPEPPERGKHTLAWNDENAPALIAAFAFEAGRRRYPDPAYIDSLVTLFQSNRQDGLSFQDAMTEVLAVVLASPGFLYLQEKSPAVAEGEAEKDSGELDARELAIRLSYFLWSAPPDDSLYAKAEDGSLLKGEVLAAEVDRLLNDPRAESFFEGFASQWAALHRFDAITVDEEVYPRFNKGIRLAASEEVKQFFGTLVKENHPARNLIDSDFVVVNDLLAQHYGIEGVQGNEFRKVALPAESPRGGMVGQAAFLTMGSTGERSSPVIRGALVMEKLLHDPPAPPPPNVPELGAEAGAEKTNRQLVEFHQRKPQCASCHKKMDAIGFGLENFDTIGQWRDTEKVGRKDVAIEPGGTIPGGGSFADLEGLKQVLLSREQGIAREMTESLLAYGLGRGIEFSDGVMLEEIMGAAKADEFRLRSLIHHIVAHPVFRQK